MLGDKHSSSITFRTGFCVEKHEDNVGGVNPRFRQLCPSNILLIDDCPYKCIGNPPFSYIPPQSYNNLAPYNYLLENLWPYLIGLFDVRSTLGYVVTCSQVP